MVNSIRLGVCTPEWESWVNLTSVNNIKGYIIVESHLQSASCLSLLCTLPSWLWHQWHTALHVSVICVDHIITARLSYSNPSNNVQPQSLYIVVSPFHRAILCSDLCNQGLCCLPVNIIYQVYGLWYDRQGMLYAIDISHHFLSPEWSGKFNCICHNIWPNTVFPRDLGTSARYYAISIPLSES